MGLQYPGEWKFEGIGFGVTAKVVRECIDLMLLIADGSKSVVEGFKQAFGSISTSSSFDWAITDLESAVRESADNAALFIDNLWKGIEDAKLEGAKVPSPEYINSILAKNGIPLKIDPPDLSFIEGSALVEKSEGANVAECTGPVPTYVLGNKIGEGGYGVVYEATRTTAVAEFSYAIKILDPSPFVKNYDKALSRFQREVMAIKTLQHRAIIPYFEAGITVDNKPYIAMPLVQGMNLREATKDAPPNEIAKIFIEILYAIQYAHENGVIHRDLKPNNILVRESDRQPIILDFGSSYLMDQMDSQALTTTAVGTIGYIPSEVISDPKNRSHLQDIYACGVMLYEAFARRLPDPADYSPLSKLDELLKMYDPIVSGSISGYTNRTSKASIMAEQLMGVLGS